MAHTTWIYADGSGINHTVGLYHGNTDGHVAIYCDKKIIQIDFGVKTNEIYSFFIEDELCEIHLIKQKNDVFYYEFKVNKVVNTPKNKERKRIQQLEYKQLALFGLALLCFVIGLLLFHHYQKNQKKPENSYYATYPSSITRDQLALLYTSGKKGLARFYVTPGSPKIIYAFQTISQTQVSASISANSNQPLQLPSGFRLNDQDAFEVIYLPDNPLVHIIDFRTPHPNTIRNYILAAIETERYSHPQSNNGRCNCIVETILQEKGWEYLAPICQQNDSPQAQKKYQALLLSAKELLNKKCPPD